MNYIAGRPEREPLKMYSKNLFRDQDFDRPSRRSSRVRHRALRPDRWKLQPQPELVEPRTLLSTFTVTNTGDVVRNADGTIQLNTDGTPVAFPGSLRAAIVGANADTDPAGATILFNMDPNDPNHVYYQDDGVAGQVSRSPSTTTASDDTLLVNPDPDHPQSWWSIKPAADLPGITRKVTIDGYSQAGAQANNLVQGDDAIIRIELDGSHTTGGGLNLRADGSTLRGLAVNR